MSDANAIISVSKRPAGARKLTPAGLLAQRAARRYAGNRTMNVKRSDALQLAKRVAAAMGLKAAKIAVIDKLFGFSPSTDWNNESASPIVWPSNNVLARQLGLSVSTARHHLRGLAAAGLIAHASHPTFQRRGVRDQQGNIIEAFGIDLSPIIARYDEFLEIALAYEDEGRARRTLSIKRTQIRREIEAVIAAARRDELSGDWQQYQTELDQLRSEATSDIGRFHEVVSDFATLRDKVEKDYSDAFGSANFDTAVSAFHHIQTTRKLEMYDESRSVNSEKNCETNGAALPLVVVKMEKTINADIKNISLDLMRCACPALTKHDPSVYKNWSTLRRAGGRLCVAAAISPFVWSEAEAQLGPDAAIVALAVTMQRAHDGIVLNPPAYLRALVQRGRAGKLHISRSLFSLAGKRNRDPDKQELSGFPTRGIAWTPWADLVRQHATKPTPDIELVANAFRAWCRKRNIDLDQPSIEKTFIGFCRKWTESRVFGWDT